jgi:competence protein ComEA
VAPTGARLFTVSLGVALVVSISLKSAGSAESNNVQSGDVQSSDPKLPDGEGRKVVATSCTGCHALSTSLEDRRTRSGWQDVVEEMAGLGANMNGENIRTAVAYLWRFFGRVNVNRASQKDIQRVAGLSSKQAAAIVKYRERGGEFRTIDDLQKVPGLDFSKITSVKERIAFTGN